MFTRRGGGFFPSRLIKNEQHTKYNIHTPALVNRTVDEGEIESI